MWNGLTVMLIIEMLCTSMFQEKEFNFFKFGFIWISRTIYFKASTFLDPAASAGSSKTATMSLFLKKKRNFSQKRNYFLRQLSKNKRSNFWTVCWSHKIKFKLLWNCHLPPTKSYRGTSVYGLVSSHLIAFLIHFPLRISRSIWLRGSFSYAKAITHSS